MGSPISNTIAEIFLQHIEDTYLKQLLGTKNIILYTRHTVRRCYFNNIWHKIHKL